MTHIIAPTDRSLAWYLAMEQYLAGHIATYPDGVFFTWVVDPTVIYGRHQVVENEVNLDYCRTHGIQVVQRKSGGGCVYADRGNLMLSYIVPQAHPEQVFKTFLDEVAAALTSLGLNAVKTEHNDILVDDSKVSGNACYALPDSTIVHGTMLYDVDFEDMTHAITPSVQKLHKHGVESVRQRVRNIRPLLEGSIDTIEALARHLERHFCDTEQELPTEAIQAIDLSV